MPPRFRARLFTPEKRLVSRSIEEQRTWITLMPFKKEEGLIAVPGGILGVMVTSYRGPLAVDVWNVASRNSGYSSHDCFKCRINIGLQITWFWNIPNHRDAKVATWNSLSHQQQYDMEQQDVNASSFQGSHCSEFRRGGMDRLKSFPFVNNSDDYFINSSLYFKKMWRETSIGLPTGSTA